MSDYKCPHCADSSVYTDTTSLLDHCRVRHRDKDLSLLVRNVSFSEKTNNRFYVRRNYHTPIRKLVGREVSIDDQLELRVDDVSSSSSSWVRRTESLPRTAGRPQHHLRPSLMEVHRDHGHSVELGPLRGHSTESGPLRDRGHSTEPGPLRDPGHTVYGDPLRGSWHSRESSPSPDPRHSMESDTDSRHFAASVPTVHTGMGSLVVNLSNELTHFTPVERRINYMEANSDVHPTNRSSQQQSLTIGENNTITDHKDKMPSNTHDKGYVEKYKHSYTGDNHIKEQSDGGGGGMGAVPLIASGRPEGGVNRSTESGGHPENKQITSTTSTKSPSLRSDQDLEAELSGHDNTTQDGIDNTDSSSIVNNTRRKLQVYRELIKRNSAGGVVRSDKPQLPPRPAIRWNREQHPAYRNNPYAASFRRKANNASTLVPYPTTDPNTTDSTALIRDKIHNKLITPDRDTIHRKMGAKHSEHDRNLSHGYKPVQGILDIGDIGKINKRYSTGALLDMQRAAQGHNPDHEGSILGNMAMFEAIERDNQYTEVPRTVQPEYPIVVSRTPLKQYSADDIHVSGTMSCLLVNIYHNTTF